MTYNATLRKTFRKARNWSHDVGGMRPRNGSNNDDTRPKVSSAVAWANIEPIGTWLHGKHKGLQATCTAPMSQKRRNQWAKKLGL